MGDHDSERNAAIKRLKDKRDFKMHLGAYVIINSMMIAIWAMSGSAGFWPVWVILFWGVGLAFHGWYAFFGNSFSESDIQSEMGKSE